MDTIKGYIDHFIYQNEDNGYCVLEIVTDKEKVTCTGIVRGYSEGENVEVDGMYTVHPIYDKQFKIQEIRILPPEDEVAIQRYLGSGAIKGIGPSMAAKIVATFGKDTFTIVAEQPERLAEIKGISTRKAYQIGEQLAAKRDLRDAMMFLQGFGISQNLSNKIYQNYGMGLYKIMRENPYKLVEDIDGVGFKTADDIAFKSGISVDSDYRIRCGIIHAILQTTIDGHCYYPKELLLDKAGELLGVAPDLLEQALLNLSMDKKIKLIKDGEETFVYAQNYYYEEQNVAQKLVELRNSYDFSKINESTEQIIRRIDTICDKTGIVLDELQIKAAYQAIESGVFVLTGGPGTGKTTTINVILELLKQYELEFYLAAPTGRAAKRMQETTGFEAKTIHRLLELNGGIEDEKRRASFERNAENPLECDVIIVDEMSMVDIHLFKALLAAIMPGTKLILVGDSYQLPSVGPGQVLKDVISSKAFATVCLEKIFRQGEDSHIVSFAHKINKGEELDLSVQFKDFFLVNKDNPQIIYDYIVQLTLKYLPKNFDIEPKDVQTMTPMKKGVFGTQTLNRELQKKINPMDSKKKEFVHGETVYREGDKVMQIKNNYELEWEILGKYNLPLDKGTGVFNGDIGYIKSINDYARTMIIVFDDNRQVYYPFENLDELELAYAITIHKSQGSEYPVIIMPLVSGPQMLFTRNLLYTGVTRAKQCVVLMGRNGTVQEMIQNNHIQKRYTSLALRISEIAMVE